MEFKRYLKIRLQNQSFIHFLNVNLLWDSLTYDLAAILWQKLKFGNFPAIYEKKQTQRKFPSRLSLQTQLILG